jgi:hypothetical protein
VKRARDLNCVDFDDSRRTLVERLSHLIAGLPGERHRYRI